MTLPADPWMQTLLLSLNSRQRSPFGDIIPEYPSEELQRNTTGLSSVAALEQAYAFHNDVTDALVKVGLPLTADSQMLDFGFGWGRNSRVLMRAVPLENIYGINVDADFVALTRKAFDSSNFTECPAFPPTQYSSGKFDLVFAYSVFSHLSEKVCREWMEEFRRVLKPGGVVAFTTRHDSFFDYCALAATMETDKEYLTAQGALIPDIEAAKSACRNGEFVHASLDAVGGGGPRDSSFYGETWIPEQFARTQGRNSATASSSWPAISTLPGMTRPALH